MADIKFQIEKKLGTLSESSKGWSKELNLISWNDNEAKYDIREWDINHAKMGKGCTFTKEELLKLRELLNNLKLDDYDTKISAETKGADELWTKVKSFNFIIGGFRGTSHYIYIRKETDISMRYISTEGFMNIDIKNKIPEEYYDCEDFTIKEETWLVKQWNAFLDEMIKCNFEKWKENYINRGIMDGTQWEIEIELNNKTKICRGGSNAYPREWKEFMKVIRKYIDEKVG
jgi:hypothetical protein